MEKYINEINDILESIPKDFNEWGKLKKCVIEKIDIVKKKKLHCLYCDGLDIAKTRLRFNPKNINKAYNNVINGGDLNLNIISYRTMFCDKCIEKFDIENRVHNTIEKNKIEQINLEKYHIKIRKERIGDNVFSKGLRGYASPYQRLIFVEDYMEDNPEKALLIKNLPYKEYLNHWYWWAISQYVKHRQPHCIFCKETKNLNVHHKTYVNKGREYATWYDDLTVLCEKCHSKFHNKLPKYN